MTLVLSCISEQWAIQVSDQRITAAGTLVDDRRNKGIQFRNEMLFAYSGLAHIAKRPTDQWFVDVLAEGKTLDAAVELSRSRLTAEFRGVANTALRRHALVGVGWALQGGQLPWRPTLVTITNALDEHGRWLSDAKPEFEVRRDYLTRPDGLRLRHLGAVVETPRLNDLGRTLKKCLRRGYGPQEMLRPMIECVWSVAERESTVGTYLLAMIAPRIGVDMSPRGLWMDPSSCDVDRPAYFNVSPEGLLESTSPACFDGRVIIYGGSYREF